MSSSESVYRSYLSPGNTSYFLSPSDREEEEKEEERPTGIFDSFWFLIHQVLVRVDTRLIISLIKNIRSDIFIQVCFL